MREELEPKLILPLMDEKVVTLNLGHLLLLKEEEVLATKANQVKLVDQGAEPLMVDLVVLSKLLVKVL